MANPFLPPTPTFDFYQAEKDEQQRQVKAKQPIVIKQADLTAGNVEYNLQRAQNFGSYKQTTAQVEPTNMREAMTNVGTELQNTSIQKDPAWWQKALGVLEPLKYLEIPIELLAEAVFDPLENMAGGTQFSWARGEAPREDFEAWKALFGKDQGTLGDRFNKAADAFEKRPLKMQLALGGLQIAATFGTGAIAKGAALSGSLAGRITASTVRAGGYAIDPAEAIFKVAGKGVKHGVRGAKSLSHTTKSVADYGVDGAHSGVVNPNAPNVNIGGRTYDDVTDNRVNDPNWSVVCSSPCQWVHHGEIPTDGDELFSYNTYSDNNPRFGLVEWDVAGQSTTGAKKQLINNPNTPWGARGDLSPVARRGNEFRRLFGDLWDKAKNTPDKWIKAEYYKNLAMIQMQLSMASRPGVIERMTWGQLKKYLGTGKLSVSEAAGQRSGLLGALDSGESFIAAHNYAHTLEDLGIPMADDDFIFGYKFEGSKLKKNKGASINNALKGFRAEGYTELTDNAQHIRNQRVSEMWLEGYTFEDIKNILGHGAENDDLIYGYITDVDVYIAPDILGNAIESPAMERLRATNHILDGVISDDNILAAIRKEADELDEIYKDVKGDKAFQQRKGKVAGGAQIKRQVLEIGEAYLRSPELDGFVDAPLKVHFDEVVNQTNIPISAQTVYAEHLRWQGLSKLTRQMVRGHTDIASKMDSISHKQASHITKQGKLQRAGFDFTKKQTSGKNLLKGDLVLAKQDWSKAKKIQDFAMQVGIDEELGSWSGRRFEGTWTPDKKAWQSWAEGLVQENNKLNRYLDEFTSVKTLTGEKGSGNITNLLSEYLDIKAIAIYNKWMELGDDLKKPFMHLEDDILDMRAAGSGRSDMLKLGKDNKKFNNNWFASRNKFITNRAHGVYNDIDPEIVPRTDAGELRYGEKTFDELDSMKVEEYNEKIRRVDGWLTNEGVMEGLKAHRIHQNVTGERLIKALKGLAKLNPDLFGASWRHRYTEVKNVKKGKKVVASRVMTSQGEAWLEDISNTILNKGLLYNFAESGSAMRIAVSGEGDEILLPLRPELFGTDEMLSQVREKTMFNSIDPDMIVGNYTPIDLVREDMSKGWGWANKWNEYNSGPAKMFMDIVRPAWSVLSGGQGPVQRSVTKPISAAGHLYRGHERDAVQVARVVKKIQTESLGLRTSAPTEQMKARGIKEGNEYYEKLETKPLDKILEFEQKLSTREAYRRYGFKRTTFEKILGVTRRGADFEHIKAIKDDEIGGEIKQQAERIIGDVGMAEPKNMLRQPDVILERIPPQYWDNYFEFGKGQKEALLYMKYMQSKIDNVALDRGVNIVKILDDKGVEYLQNYFPRVYRKPKDRIRLGGRAKPIKLLNSYNSHFQARQQKDILDNLAISADDFAKSPDSLNRAVLEPVDQRLAMYYETMMKEGTNVETRKALLDLTKGQKAFASDAAREFDELNNLERILNERFGGRVTLDHDRAARLTKAYTLRNDANALLMDKAIAKHQWLLNDSPETIARIRKSGEYDKVVKSIDARKQQLSKDWELNDMGTEVQAGMWLDDVFKRMTKQDQNSIRQYVEATPPLLMKPVAKVAETIEGMTQLFRTLKAGFDMGTPMIHGFNSAVKLPWMINGKLSWDGQAAWGKSVNNMKKAFMHPDYLDKYMIDNYALRAEASPWVMLGEAEPLQSLQSDYGPMKILRENAAKILDDKPGLSKIKAAQRFETSFVMFTDSLRMELWQSLAPSMRRMLKETVDSTGKRLDPDDLTNPAVRKAHRELGDSINKSTGVFDQDLAGMTPLQRLLESSLVFFAPMYRRATYGIIADLGRGKVKRREAMRQLTGVIGAGTIMGTLVEYTGNNDRGFVFDHETGEADVTARFGKLNIGGYQVGIGTAWWTAFRLASDLAMMPTRPDDSIDEEWYDNPYMTLLGRKGRSQLAPGAGFVLDMWQGRTFTGDPLKDKEGDADWSEILKHSGSQILPFWADVSVGAGWGAAAAVPSEFFGFQSYPISEYDKLSKSRMYAVHNWDNQELIEWRQDQMASGGKLNWITLPDNLKKIINDGEPATRAALENYEEAFGPVAKGNSALFRGYRDKKSQHDLMMVKELASASHAFEKGDIDGREFGERKSKAYFARRKNSEALLDSAEYMPLVQWFTDLRNNGEKSDMTFQGDILFDKWMTEVVHNETNTDPETGEFLYENYQELEDIFRAKFQVDEEDWKYLQDRKRYWTRELPVVRDYEDSLEMLAPYWKAHDTIWKPGTKMNTYATEYYKKPQSIRNQMKRRNKLYREIDKAVQNRRAQIRDARPDIDWLLVKWYGNVPRHVFSKQKEVEQDRVRWSKRMQEDANWNWDTPQMDDFSVSPSGRVNVNPELTGA